MIYRDYTNINYIERLSELITSVQNREIKFSENATDILKKRYLIKDDNGKVIETPREMIFRVVSHITDDVELQKKFFDLIADAKFLPNTPTLVNAGRPLGMLSACLVLPTGDSIEEWAESLKNHMICVKSGVGTGFDFSDIRREGAYIHSTGGRAGGVPALLSLLNESARQVKQGSIRQSANMGTLRLSHPDIETFINIKNPTKSSTGELLFNKIEMFNLSVTGTDDEFEQLFNGKEIKLWDVNKNDTIRTIDANKLLRTIATNVWKGGDPGLQFTTTINKNNRIQNKINPITGKKFGKIVTSNPCGEQTLYPYSVCNLGSINLTKYVHYGVFDLQTFDEDVRLAITFLDKVIDANKYPLYEIEEMAYYLRNIGLGIMGWADALIMMNIRYDSEEALTIGRTILSTFRYAAKNQTKILANELGCAPVFIEDLSINDRNYETTCIAPTGTISMIAGCSSGIEPNFSYVTLKKTTIKDFIMINEQLRDYLQKFDGNLQKVIIDMILNNNGLINDEIAKKMGYNSMKECPFVSTFDVSPEWHLKHQALFQEFIDNAVSKTINVPEETTVDDIIEIYKKAWKMKVKGITIYRNNSRNYQILNTAHDDKVKKEALELMGCKHDSGFHYAEGCKICKNCGVSFCN